MSYYAASFIFGGALVTGFLVFLVGAIDGLAKLLRLEADSLALALIALSAILLFFL